VVEILHFYQHFDQKILFKTNCLDKFHAERLLKNCTLICLHIKFWFLRGHILSGFLLKSNCDVKHILRCNNTCNKTKSWGNNFSFISEHKFCTLPKKIARFA